MRDRLRTWRLGVAGLFALALLLLAGPQAAQAHAGHHHHAPVKRAQSVAAPLILARTGATTVADSDARLAAPMASGGGAALAAPPAPPAFALDDHHPSLDLARLIGEGPAVELKAPKADCPSGHIHSGNHTAPADGQHPQGDGSSCCCLVHCAAPAGLAAAAVAGPSQGPVANALPMTAPLLDGIAHGPGLRPPQTSG